MIERVVGSRLKPLLQLTCCGFVVISESCGFSDIYSYLLPNLGRERVQQLT